MYKKMDIEYNFIGDLIMFDKKMAIFYFVRHGQMDMSMAGEKFYKGFAVNMMTLSEKGVNQILETAKDERLANAELIITSPFGRTLHSAAFCISPPDKS